MNTQAKIEALFKPLPKRYSVAYALACAESVLDLAKGNDKAKAEACIDLVKRWLSGEPGLENQLESAASAASAAYAASAASAAWAAYAASAAYAAYSAASAANAAYWAAYAASAAYAAYSAASAAKAGKAGDRSGKAYDKEIEEYYSKAKAFVEAIPEVERLLWL